MKKVVTIVGARPQFIKAAVLTRIIKEQKKIEEVMVHTGQHYDKNMSDIFFEEMNISKPKYTLNLGEVTGHGNMTGNMMIKIEPTTGKRKTRCRNLIRRYKFYVGGCFSL